MTPGDMESQQDESKKKSRSCYDMLTNCMTPKEEELFKNALPPLPDQGYRTVARMMAIKGLDMPIFRRFGQLNMLNLLSLQAELMKLHEQLKWVCQDDDADEERHKYAWSFEDLIDEDKRGGALNEQWGILKKIRSKLKEYNEALLQVSQVQQLEAPSKQQIRDFQLFTLLSECDCETKLFQGAEQFTWNDHSDLITICPRNLQADNFQNVMADWIVNINHKFRGHRKKGERIADHVIQYDLSLIDRLCAMTATMLAAVLPIIAVLILNEVHNISTRIYITIGLTALFAIAVSTVTSASRIEVFAATAAFVAVEVVFIGNADPNLGN
ncbi:hypothetical protein K432DRAFT_364712 [Lepidopterella palustris CBS 459.81]|uniref:DUF6594 domain-containing protein n=1 Tax=Lepidopterella palustris CBS 459.81 TaxID=1314670 RepID=A0A8E2DXS5_9PEZI|nr:hypothetical protein K432DRAFT_364712 [Lepidopterella palustris CBS 459.81]